MEISILGTAPYCHVRKRLPIQLLRVMKLTAVIIVAACLHVSASSFSQNVSFSGKNVPLQTVFASIEKQTGLSFFFNYALIKNTKPVSLDVQNAPMEELLKEALKGQGLDFYKTGKTIFIVKLQVARSQNVENEDKQDVKMVDIRGRVRNQQGEALPGATVIIKNGKKSTLTDEKGMFELKNVAVGIVLEITYLGYQKKEIEIEKPGMIDVELAAANSRLDEVQVIAYGNTTERLSTGNVTTVKADVIERQPVTNPLLALEGRVPGLFITQSNGLPGGGVQVTIQGQNSISNGNDPLYVIDGVPYISQLLPNIGLILGASSNLSNTVNGSGNPLNYINPTDIESISVLKDADATAIYGSRAANGAILITTKKGRLGKTNFDINLQDGVGQVAHKLKLLNLSQYLQMRHEALKNDGITKPSSTDYDINGLWDTTRYTDWQKQLIGKTGQYHNANISFSGGSGNTQYLISGTFHHETTVFPGDFSDRKGGVHFNINNSSSNQKFKIQFSGSYFVDNDQLLSTDLTQWAIRLAPDAPKLYNADGTMNWMPNAAGSSSWINPVSFTYNTYQNKSNNLISNTIISYQILPGLNIKTSLGYSKLQSNEIAINPLIANRPETQRFIIRRGVFANYSIDSWIGEPQISYSYNVNKSNLVALVGLSFQENTNNSMSVTGSGYNTDQSIANLGSASSFVASSLFSEYKYNALFGRLNYNWAGKYLVNLTARRDGSSRFGVANQFQNFGSIGIGWVFTNESYFQKKLSLISFGKIKGSYGTTGNDQIGNYNYLSLYNNITGGVPYQGTSGLLPSGLSNPYLQWELTKKLEFGLDIGFLKDRIIFTGNYFQNRSSNQLLPYALPIITGVGSVTKNFPATVQNNGLELVLTTVNVKSKSFSWTTSLNFTAPRNKLLSFPNLSNSSYYNTLIVGRSISITKLYHLIGVNSTTGEYQFSDSKGNSTYNPSFSDDRTVVLDLAPKYYGGMENNFSYKAFRLDIALQFTKRKGPSYRFGNFFQPGYPSVNQPTSILSRWQKPNDITNIQRYNANSSLSDQWSYANGSDAGYTDASYIRFKNISFSWQMPAKWRSKANFTSMSLYVQGQNLLTITNYKELDPETLSNQTLPPLRVITFGLQVAF